jgi:hypothetical protein
MSDVLHSLSAKICWVSFFGMKWEIPNEKPMIHYFAQQYHAKMGFLLLYKIIHLIMRSNFLISELQLTTLVKVDTRPARLGKILCTKCVMCKAMGLWILDQLFINILLNSRFIRYYVMNLFLWYKDITRWYVKYYMHDAY